MTADNFATAQPPAPTTSPVAYLTLDQVANSYSVSTRSLLRAEAKGQLRISRPFGSGSKKLYVSAFDLDLFFRRGLKVPRNSERGALLTEARKRKHHTPRVKTPI
jgi:hypothetical protein